MSRSAQSNRSRAADDRVLVPAEEGTGRRTFGPQPSPEELAIALRDTLAQHRGERHVIAIQDFPDPDAISSALAYRAIAREFGITADIVYQGLISHPENLALVNLLELDLLRFTEEMPLGEYDAAVFIDNQGATTRLTGRLKEKGIPTLIVIDHHEPQDLLDPEYADVRPLGAAATQVAQYLATGELLELDRTNEEHVRIATALLHGLHSETHRFVQAARPEFEAAAFLCEFADPELLERVLCVQKSRGTMDTIQAALGRRVIRGGLSLAGVGYLRWADRDAIPQAADFLLEEENVHTAVVYGMASSREDRQSIIGSLRTNNATLGVDAFLKQALGKDVAGRYYGGGRTRAGGFEIDLGFLAGNGVDPAEREAKWSLFDRQIRRRFFEAAGLDSDRNDTPAG